MPDVIFTKEELIQKLKAIRERGWIPNTRHGNSGGVGNTLEDLLGIKENNLPIPNAGEWELKCQRSDTSSLLTLFHMEPSPRALKFVSKTLLPKYGWPAGEGYPELEMSFRQTITGSRRSDRGFAILIDRQEQKAVVSFNANDVAQRHEAWLNSVEVRAGHLQELNPQPYWGLIDLYHKFGSKLTNCFYVQADVERRDNREYYHYNKIYQLQNLSVEGLIIGIEEGYIFVDFDARTHHNHGTKFRLVQDKIPVLYSSVQVI